MFLLAIAHAAPPEDLWVELPTDAARHAADDAGLTWSEGQEGSWYRLLGTPDAADAAGLRWRRDMLGLEGYSPTPEEVAARLGALSTATIVQIGESVEGRAILAARFGDGPRALRILGGHHGDEGSSVEVALAVAEALDVEGAPADTEIWVVPAVNPDGLAAGTRANAAGVDLNRNYAWEWTDAATNGAEPFSEPETRAVRALARARAFDAGLMLHSGAQNLGWVWNWTSDIRPVEEELLSSLAEDYASLCTAPGFYITNGADWYITHGDATDWTYGTWGVYDYTLELTGVKSPAEADVVGYTAWHLDAILAWIAAPPDTSDIVTDALTGEPIPSWITSDSQPLWSPNGVFSRWGTGPWTFGAPGYEASSAPALLPTDLLDTLPEPRLLSQGAGPVTVRVHGASAGPLTLVQPGESAVVLAADGPGAWTVDASGLASGAWSLVLSEGVIPRGLFVGEVDDRVALDSAELRGGLLTFRGTGFATGAEAWSIGGPARAVHALARVSATDDTLVFAGPSADEDVLLWVNGAWLAAVGVQGAALVDDTPPPERAGEEVVPALLEDEELHAAGACASASGPLGLGWLLIAGVRRARPRPGLRRSTHDGRSAPIRVPSPKASAQRRSISSGRGAS